MELRNEAFHLLRQLFQQHTARWQQALPDLTKPQYAVMRSVAEQPGIEQVVLIEAAENLQDEVRASHSGLSGELRITTTPEYGAQVIIQALAAFSRHHPALRVRHVSSSHHADLIYERFDVAIRLGTLADSRYRATRIASFAILPVASPAWLASHPLQTLSDLAQADWIIHERLPAPLRWQLRTDEQAEVDFTIVNAPRFSADSATASVSRRRRVERSSRVTPSSFSSCLTLKLTTALVCPSAAAAWVKLPASTTAINMVTR